MPALIQFLPNIRALSLQNNKLSNIKLLNSLSSHVAGSKTGLGHLEELILTGNPVRDDLEQEYEAQYRSDVVKRFPTIRILDQQPIDVPIVVPPRAPKPRPSAPQDVHKKEANHPAVFPGINIAAGFSDSEPARSLVGQFLTR
jgi:hypothetical protein